MNQKIVSRKIVPVAAVLLVIVLALAVLLSGLPVTGFFGLQGESSTVKVGVIGVLSGPVASSWGLDAKNGIELAVEDAKDLYGIDLEIIQGDSSAKPEQGLSEFKQMSALHNPDVFIVEASAVASAIAPVAKDYNKPIVFTAVAAENITSGSELLFRNFYLCEQEAPFMAEKAFGKIGAKKVAVLFQKDAFGESCSKLFRQRFEEIGGKVVSSEGFLANETDFRTQLLKIQAIDIDAIYAPGYAPQLLGIVKQMKEIGLSKTILASRLVYSSAIRKDVVANINPPQLFFTGNDYYLGTSESASFIKRFGERFGSEPSHVAAYAYDSILLIAKASKISEEKNIPLADALAMAKVSGVNGEISFNEKRETSEPIYLITINAQGKAEKVD